MKKTATNTTTKTIETTKKPHIFGSIVYFYLKQALKAALIFVLSYSPTTMTINYINAVPHIKKITSADLFVAQSSIQLYAALSAVILGIGIWFIITRLNWRAPELKNFKLTFKKRG